MKVAALTAANHPIRKWRKFKESAIEAALFLAAASSVFVIFGIIFILVSESLPFFGHVSLVEFLTETEWSPLFENPRYGILPLLSGTLVSTMIAISVAIPMGTIIASYLSEYANEKAREILKPVLELLAAVPTVVYGYFALLFVTPLLKTFLPELSGFNILSAGLVMGVMIVPYISSLSEDAMRAVPNHLREGSYAMGASKFQTIFRVVIPASFSGMTSAYILGISRALGETMVVTVAAGLQPRMAWDPTQPAATITAYIVQVSLGDLPHGSIGYQSIYVAGLTLLVITLSFNVIGLFLRKRFQESEN